MKANSKHEQPLRLTEIECPPKTWVHYQLRELLSDGSGTHVHLASSRALLLYEQGQLLEGTLHSKTHATDRLAARNRRQMMRKREN